VTANRTLLARSCFDRNEFQSLSVRLARIITEALPLFNSDEKPACETQPPCSQFQTAKLLRIRESKLQHPTHQ
jgi:hypothetical protein